MTFNIEGQSLGKMPRALPFREIEDGSALGRVKPGSVQEQPYFHRRCRRLNLPLGRIEYTQPSARRWKRN